MSFNQLALGYCTNVHPTASLAQLEQNLRDYAGPIRRKLAKPVAAGLWFSDAVARQALEAGDAIQRLNDTLRAERLVCYSLNAFPFGDFHGPRVKSAVYQPAWDAPARFDYTRRCATLLAALLPDGIDGSISTLPLGFNGADASAFDEPRAIEHLIELARNLHRLESTSGKTIRLAIEPEPLCLLETTQQTIAFFSRLFARAAAHAVGEATVRRHIGVCFDVCHQAVEFESMQESMSAIHESGVRINKVHLSCAIRVHSPMQDQAARSALRAYVEPRYLHQALARQTDGRVCRADDLTLELIERPSAEFAAASEWRIHFHVPIHLHRLGSLATTRAQLEEAVTAVAALPYAPHLEVETYTWEILPDSNAPSVVDGICCELAEAGRLVAACAVLHGD